MYYLLGNFFILFICLFLIETIDEEKPSSLQENQNAKQIIPIGSRLGELRTERPPSGRAKTPALLQARKNKQNEVF